MSAYRIFGIVLAVVGLAAAVFPAWFGPLTQWPEPPADVFEAIERRVRGGMILGVGWAFIAIPALRPWSISIASTILYFATGALVARFIGLLVEGTVQKQWLLVAVEAVIMVLAALWLWRAKRAAD
ncbi:MAG: hypothetical protein KJO07_04150 [Deltaproteobacteria bacterium]|nr:hypothetical protein [Deltaproteobacteria bacterium]